MKYFSRNLQYLLRILALRLRVLACDRETRLSNLVWCIALMEWRLEEIKQMRCRNRNNPHGHGNATPDGKDVVHPVATFPLETDIILVRSGMAHRGWYTNSINALNWLPFMALSHDGFFIKKKNPRIVQRDARRNVPHRSAREWKVRMLRTAYTMSE